jgi:DNA mismatch repair protein MutH
MKYIPPGSEQELLARVTQITGKTLQYVANLMAIQLPNNLSATKGLTGELLETYLGATAGNLPEPDFQRIGVELKTVPVNRFGKPRESTYVCTVTLLPDSTNYWEQSLVKRKLSRVLWIPVESEPEIPLSMRRIGNPIMWSPSTEQEQILKQDWEELMDMIIMGQLERITAHYGKYLQIRPKAQDGKSLQAGIGADGGRIQTLPRGFYLRTEFTGTIISQ